MIVREADWKDSVPFEHPNEVIVRMLPDGRRMVYRPGQAPLTLPKVEPRYTKRDDPKVR
jgi:hypothetical protein